MVPMSHNKDKHGNLPLINVCKSSLDLEVIKFLIEHSADINGKDKHGNTLLAILCSSKYQSTYDDKIKYLLNKGADINIMNDDGFTPLTLVCNNNKYYKIIYKIWCNY